MSSGQVAMFIIGTIVIIFGAYYVTGYIGKKAQGATNIRSSRSIIIRERFAISKDKSFCLIELEGTLYFIGVTGQSMTLLDTFEADKTKTVNVIRKTTTPGLDRVTKGIVESFASVLSRRGGTKIHTEKREPEEPSETGNSTESDGLDIVYKKLRQRRNSQNKDDSTQPSAWEED